MDDCSKMRRMNKEKYEISLKIFPHLNGRKALIASGNETRIIKGIIYALTFTGREI